MTQLAMGQAGKILRCVGGETICRVETNGEGHLRLGFCTGRFMEIQATQVESDDECCWPMTDILVRVSIHDPDHSTIAEVEWEE